jgi:hypothetical protein
MHGDLPNLPYRALELLCRAQAAFSTTPAVRDALEEIAAQYGKLAVERQGPEPDQPYSSETSEPDTFLSRKTYEPFPKEDDV